ncbi:TRAP transporter large permease subunit [uncultured Vibrio sp.]|uniref:TRAP transporter large permease n=1 Tax=uncultured Vibrio sp. TaxID=114054 RepID=UPI00261333A6|nr:TRAP transporter large permease subunit [uncultured Vibrio sp.]
MAISFLTPVLLLSVLALLILGVPLAFSTGAAASGLVLFNFGVDGLALIATRIYGLMSSYSFVAIPMFVMMATTLERSGVTKDLFRVMYLLAGKIKGGLAIQTLFVSIILASMSGIIGGEIVLLGVLALPEMLKRGYDKKLAIGTVCAGGALGTMIPPSVVLIVYGLATETNIGDLFIAVLVPGLMLASFYMLYVLYVAFRYPEKAPVASMEELQISKQEKRRLLKGTLLPIFVAFWVLFCIYSGIASINEAAAMGVIGALLSTYIRNELTFDLVKQTCVQTMKVCGMIMWIVFGATALIGVFNMFGGSTFVSNYIQQLDVSPLSILLFMMLILFVLGVFMDWIGICLLTMPIFVPIISGLGYDPVWFGVLFTLNMQLSYLTPPFGPAAFYLKGVVSKDITMTMIYSSFVPFIAIQMVAIALLIAFPSLATWLPEMLR